MGPWLGMQCLPLKFHQLHMFLLPLFQIACQHGLSLAGCGCMVRWSLAHVIWKSTVESIPIPFVTILMLSIKAVETRLLVTCLKSKHSFTSHSCQRVLSCHAPLSLQQLVVGIKLRLKLFDNLLEMNALLGLHLVPEHGKMRETSKWVSGVV